MRLEDLTIVLRPRRSWEAMDLGCALVRRDYGRILTVWLVTVLPVWAVLAALLWEWPIVFGTIIWWLKPLFDRLPLYLLSRSAFGEKPTPSSALREWPRLWSRFLFSALLWRRLSLIRSFALPVLMLEGQRGKAARSRVAALASDGGGSGTTATFIFLHLEWAVYFGLLALTSSLGPADGLPDFKALLDDPESLSQSTPAQLWMGNLLYLLTITLTEPFYVGAGFGLYLNSRSKLEGWDIELAFRRMAARLRPAASALLLILGALFMTAPQAMAQQEKNSPVAEAMLQELLRKGTRSKRQGGPNAGQSPESSANPESGAVGMDKKAVREKLAEVLAQPEFKEHSVTRRIWKPSEKKRGSTTDFSFIAPLFQALGYALVAVAVGFLIWLIVKSARLRSGLSLRGMQAATPTARVIMGMEITAESLPDDILAAARAAWAAGQLREALSLLYRGSLYHLVSQHRLPIRDSDTEDDCLMHVARLGEERVTGYFRQLTLLWVRAAYAGRMAAGQEFDHLCAAWPFSATTSKQRSGLFQAAALLCLLLPACDGKWVDETTELGHKGKARLQPFLAAQQLLERLGHEARQVHTLQEMPPPERSMLVVSAEGGMPEGRSRQLLQWVKRGGHLLYALEGCAPANDWASLSGGGGIAALFSTHDEDPLLRELKIKAKGGVKVEQILGFMRQARESLKEKDAEGSESPDDAEAKEAKPVEPDTLEEEEDHDEEDLVPEEIPHAVEGIVIGGQTFRLDVPKIHTLKLSRKLKKGEFIAGTPGAASVLSLHHGNGRVTVLTHARPLRNRWLDENDHAPWLAALLAEGAHEVRFLTALQGSFFALLWSRAWMPIIGLGVIVLAWLGMHLPRFGPIRRVELHETRHFADHLSSLGQFFHRLRRDDVLLAAVQDAVRVRALKARPHLAADEAALHEWLAAVSAQPVEQIRALLAPVKGALSPHQLTRRIAALQKLASDTQARPPHTESAPA